MRVRKSHIFLTAVVIFIIVGVSIIYHRYQAIAAQLRHQLRHPQPPPSAPITASDAAAILAANSAASTAPSPHLPTAQSDEIVVVVVACQMRLDETLNMIKSVLIFHVDRRPLRFVVVAADDLQQAFAEKLHDWQEASRRRAPFTFDILPLAFPAGNEKVWRELFKPCASQRLFLPNILNTTDAVLYVDTDTLFLSPVSRIWSLFGRFNASQMAGLSPEHEDRNVGWYNRFARHPFYGALGVNSGVMLMNLTRMRAFKWVDYIVPLHREYRLKITWGDQDLINILFHFHPDKLFVFPCEWNYRPDHCMYMPVCAAPQGVQILHGNRGYFHAATQPAFSAAYAVVKAFRVGSDGYRNVLLPLESALADDAVALTNCGHTVERMLVVPRAVLKESADYYYSEVGG